MWKKGKQTVSTEKGKQDVSTNDEKADDGKKGKQTVSTEKGKQDVSTNDEKADDGKKGKQTVSTEKGKQDVSTVVGQWITMNLCLWCRRGLLAYVYNGVSDRMNALVAGNGSYIVRLSVRDLHSPTSPFLHQN